MASFIRHISKRYKQIGRHCMIKFRQKGDFSKLTRFLERAKETVRIGDLDKFGKEGVAALASATPVDSGETASSWYYEIENRKGSVTISFHNSNIQNGVPIAIFCNTGMELETAAGYRGEITSILLSSLFLTKLQITHGRRLLSYEQDN